MKKLKVPHLCLIKLWTCRNTNYKTKLSEGGRYDPQLILCHCKFSYIAMTSGILPQAQEFDYCFWFVIFFFLTILFAFFFSYIKCQIKEIINCAQWFLMEYKVLIVFVWKRALKSSFLNLFYSKFVIIWLAVKNPQSFLCRLLDDMVHFLKSHFQNN